MEDMDLKVVWANRFVLEDENGTVRAALTMNKGRPMLNLADEKGKVRARLIVDNGGPELRLFDENGEARAVLGVGEKGASLFMFDETGKAIWAKPSESPGRAETP